MDQFPAQNLQVPPEVSAEIPPPQAPSENTGSSSPFKKKIILLLLLFLFAVFILAGLLFAGSKSTKTDTIIPTPSIRPSATPLVVPSVTYLPTQTATSSATIIPSEIGRLIFIKDGDIYQSNFESYSLLVDTVIPAGDKLKWSPSGNFISWRPKSGVATPSAVTVYNRNAKDTKMIKPGTSTTDEVIDYAWSGSDSELMVVSRDASYNLLLYNLASATPTFKNLLKRQTAINQLETLGNKKILFRGTEGIGEIDSTSGQMRTIVNKQNVLNMKLSPDSTKIAYSLGDKQKSELFIVNVDGYGEIKIDPEPGKINLNNTGVTLSALSKGFSDKMVWFPSADKLFIGFGYLPGLPMVGIYEIKTGNFQALAPFTMHSDDMMFDERRLIGTRVSGQESDPQWRVSIFTTEDNSKLGVIRVFPGASSFAFYGKE